MTSMMSLHLLYRLLVSLQGRDNAYQQYCLLICPPPPFGLLTSTVNLQQHNVFCPPRPIENTVDNTLVSHNVSQVSSDSRLETTEEHVDNVIESVTDTSAEDSGPSWNETPVGIHPSAEESIIDPFEQKQLAGASWNVETAMLDFELALRNALKSVFVGIHLQGCWFHYCQAIWRRVHHLKLDGEYPHKAHGGKYIKRIMSLALMNANGSMIESMFEMLQHNYRSKDRHHLTIPVQKAFDELFAYVAKQWIYNPKLPTSELSVFDTPVRTNNEVENWNGQLWNTVNRNPQSFYKLLKVLKKVSVSSRQEVRSKLRNSKRSAQIAIDKTIQGIWDKMKDRAIAPKKALYALCQETERNNIMTYNRDMMSYTCLDIDACDEFDD